MAAMLPWCLIFFIYPLCLLPYQASFKTLVWFVTNLLKSVNLATMMAILQIKV